ncbi:MAG TPA: NUDIX domain-containing protein [Tepidisphaeraceae bacterium]|nr:NUDIX domain-containing protein [Tepidisphaeraceae bacterium]
MGISNYIRHVRRKIGHDLLLLPAISAIIIDDRGHVLLHRSSDDGKWYTIGGAVDPGEDPADAAVREAKEETGLDVVPERIIGVYTSPEIEYPNKDLVVYTSITFLCRPVGGTLRVADDESLEVAYFAPHALPDLRDDQRRRVLEAYKPAAHAWFRHNGQWKNGG